MIYFKDQYTVTYYQTNGDMSEFLKYLGSQ